MADNAGARGRNDAKLRDRYAVPRELEPLVRPIGEISLDTKNARVHPARQMDEIEKSLRRFGMRDAVKVTPDGVVVAGNGRLAAARRMGWTHVPVIVVESDTAREYALADNRIGELAEWDVLRLADELGAMSDPVGWDQSEIDEILDAASDSDQGPDDFGALGDTSKPKRLDPVLTVFVKLAESDVVESAIDRAMSMGAPTRGAALQTICEEWSDGH